MVLLNALVQELVIASVKFIVLVGCMVGGILLGKKLKDSSDAKKSAQENEQ